MISTTLSLHGGGSGDGGINAEYGDMITQADTLQRLAISLGGRVGVVAAVARDDDVLASTILSPATAAHVEQLAVAASLGPHGLLPTAAGLEATSVVLRTAVHAYQAADDAIGRTLPLLEGVAAVPTLLAPLLIGAERIGIDITSGNLWGLVRDVKWTGDAFMDNLYDNPWIVDGVIVDFVAVMWAFAAKDPISALLISQYTSRTVHAPFPPNNLEQAIADLIALGRLGGLFRSGGVKVTPHRDADRNESRLAPPGLDVKRPSSLGELFRGIAGLEDKDKSTHAKIRIFKVTDATGTIRWVVELPGVEEWSPVAGSNPVDLTTSFELMGGVHSEYLDGVKTAMHEAGIQQGQEVLLAGHSLGGITAAALASDAGVSGTYNITHVVTGGSPIADFHIPHDVSVLSIEHKPDVVPRLDLRENPDRPNWLTVTRDPTGIPLGPGQSVDNTAEAHGAAVGYPDTADLVAKDADPHVRAMIDGLTPFFDCPGTNTTLVQDFDIVRT